ncbi:hypothetical protein L3V43_20615 [Pseudoalteromonas sp. L23]|uniref:hypothetical protein n=1 Tax=unclassified Pseudoalteromonas TaxID=194690 RepID=UPI001EF0C011|nr:MULTISPECIES: hypothetical protein [unclassified Pseudoalteromonas]MCF7515972.1 hypothetical protein [Pseudoalteromonas sp. L7]MCF7528056.1 hypothetical protein [Pseudoalteromonas sp. L23]
MLPLPQNFTNTGQMPINGGHATSGNGDSVYNNHTRFGGMTYNKGIPQWAIFAAVGVALVLVFGRAKR